MKQSTHRAAAFAAAAFVVACGAVESDDAEDSLAESAQAAKGSISTTTACFTGRPPLTSGTTIVGTVFKTAGTTPSTALLLLHGSGSNRQFWDGGPAGPIVGDSFARRMADRGYLVVSIDRFGYGESVDPRISGGRLNTMDLQITLVNEVVGQLKTGNYKITSGATCAVGTNASPISKVVLVGHSLGAFIGVGYVPKYRDVHGLVSIGGASQGPTSSYSNTAMDLATKYVFPQIAAEYIYFFPPWHPDAEADCLNFAFHEPATYAIDTSVCKRENLRPSPSGETHTEGAQLQENRRGISNYPAGFPVLNVVGQFDKLVPGPENTTGDQDLRTEEFDYWAANCPCAASSYVQPNTGHANPFHKNLPALSGTIGDFLRRHNL